MLYKKIKKKIITAIKTFLLNYRYQYFVSVSIFKTLMQKFSLAYAEFRLRFVCKNIPSLVVFYKADWFHQFAMCIDLIAYDRPRALYRFSVIYYLLSVLYNSRYQISTQVAVLGGVESISAVHYSINWSERELWDMFGVIVYYHPDLRRLLTDYGFQGFPLRKDFPVSGF